MEVKTVTKDGVSFTASHLVSITDGIVDGSLSWKYRVFGSLFTTKVLQSNGISTEAVFEKLGVKGLKATLFGSYINEEHSDSAKLEYISEPVQDPIHCTHASRDVDRRKPSNVLPLFSVLTVADVCFDDCRRSEEALCHEFGCWIQRRCLWIRCDVFSRQSIRCAVQRRSYPHTEGQRANCFRFGGVQLREGENEGAHSRNERDAVTEIDEATGSCELKNVALPQVTFSQLVSRGFSIAAEASYNRMQEEMSMITGVRYEVDTTTIKMKADDSGGVSFAYITRVDPAILFTMSASTNVKDMEKGNRFGLAITIDQPT